MFNNIFNNLYVQILTEALWDQEIISQVDTPFSNSVYKIYELEYKLNALNNYPFNGDPRRLENIKRQVTLFLSSNLKTVQNVLLNVFKKWLSSHAITKPRQWAEARYNDLEEQMGDKEIFESVIGEYDRYVKNNKTDIYGRPVYYDPQRFFNVIASNISKLPYTKSILEPIYKQILQDEYINDPEGTMESWQVSTPERADKYIEDSILDIHTFEYVVYDIDSLIDIMSEYGDIKTFFIEIYEKLVFPVWYGNWKTQGIDKTRKNIENAYKGLKSANTKNIGNMVAQISIALNAAHQTGPMLDYIEQYTGEDTISDNDDTFGMKELLDKLTKGLYIDNWNDDLKEIGINI